MINSLYRVITFWNHSLLHILCGSFHLFNLNASIVLVIFVNISFPWIFRYFLYLFKWVPTFINYNIINWYQIVIPPTCLRWFFIFEDFLSIRDKWKLPKVYVCFVSFSYFSKLSIVYFIWFLISRVKQYVIQISLKIIFFVSVLFLRVSLLDWVNRNGMKSSLFGSKNLFPGVIFKKWLKHIILVELIIFFILLIFLQLIELLIIISKI